MQCAICFSLTCGRNFFCQENTPSFFLTHYPSTLKMFNWALFRGLSMSLELTGSPNGLKSGILTYFLCTSQHPDFFSYNITTYCGIQSVTIGNTAKVTLTVLMAYSMFEELTNFTERLEVLLNASCRPFNSVKERNKIKHHMMWLGREENWDFLLTVNAGWITAKKSHAMYCVCMASVPEHLFDNHLIVNNTEIKAVQLFSLFISSIWWKKK